MIICILDDFHIQKIADSGQCFRCRTFDNMYRFITGEHIIYIKPISSTEYDISCTMEEWNTIWIPYFDLTTNYEQIRNSLTPDPFLSKAIETGVGIRILRQDAWEMVISFIISQRKSIPAIKKAIEALSKLYGKPIQTEHETVYTFPSISSLAAADDSTLSSCGLGYRLPYIKDTAAYIHTHDSVLKTWASFDDNTLFNALKTLKGVGDKVASCIMLFAYGRTASVPVDTWIKKIIENKYDGHNPFLEYEKNAGLIQQYVFYYIQQNKSEIL